MKQKQRREKDNFGEINVPQNKYWGINTQRSLKNFNIGNEHIPLDVVKSIAIVKMAAAKVNLQQKKLPKRIALSIAKASQEIINGKYTDQFPLSIWQTGSGTQTNMNVNEVIANRAIEILKGVKGSKNPVHPNDHVNLSQSTNDVFPTAMHIAAVQATKNNLLPALKSLEKILDAQSKKWNNIIKIGRTHMQDAVPITLGQEFSAFKAQITNSQKRLNDALKSIYYLPIGGTAVGTGLNTLKNYDAMAVREINKITKLPFKVTNNKFESQATHDSLADLSGSLNLLAIAIMKIANDIRFLASGPRAGIGELALPENESGSSIMPGKVNPTQIEALTMICAQVMGNNITISFAASQGHLQLNAYKPVVAFNILQSINLLSDGINSFTLRCAKGIKPNLKKIKENLNNSLMLVTPLTPKIGYDKAAKITQYAHQKGISLKKACLDLKILSGNEYEKLVQPKKMIKPS